jgi:TRAP-type C4-dicarboxylate transport system permease small subunit
MLFSTIDVIVRGALDISIGPVMSVCECMMVVMTFAGMAKTEEEGSHINVIIFTSKVSAKKQEILKVVGSAACVIFFLLMLYATLQDGLWAYSVKTYRTGDLWRFPTWWCRLFIPLGIVVMIGQLIKNIKTSLKKLRFDEKDMAAKDMTKVGG